MAALLVAMSVAAVLLSVAMPVWKQMATRERETELIFRGQQYVRAIALFQRRAGPGVLPPSLDVLVQQRLLRKKYKDPITGDDFDLLTPVQTTAQAGQTAGGGSGPGGGAARGTGAASGTGSVVVAQPAGRGGAAGIMGVASKSKASSIRVYNGRTHYNEWQFVYVQQAQTPAAGRGGQPQRGQPPAGPSGGSPVPQRGSGAGPSSPNGRGAGGRGAQPSPFTPSSPFSAGSPRPPG
ncbi:MAG: hypothetical protein AB7J63_12365 [Vicinamibacterales bacterium]